MTANFSSMPMHICLSDPPPTITYSKRYVQYKSSSYPKQWPMSTKLIYMKGRERASYFKFSGWLIRNLLPIFRSPKALFARNLFKERKRCCFGTSQQRHLNSDASLPKEAEIVICGGGIVGCSVAYHLAKLGWRDVLLLEQGRYETE